MGLGISHLKLLYYQQAITILELQMQDIVRKLLPEEHVILLVDRVAHFLAQEVFHLSATYLLPYESLIMLEINQQLKPSMYS